MTPQEKAKDLVNKFTAIQEQIEWTKDKQLMELCGERNDALGDEGEYYWQQLANQCALIAVDEVINALHEHHWQNRLIIDYWNEVKIEIEKL